MNADVTLNVYPNTQGPGADEASVLTAAAVMMQAGYAALMFGVTE